jgi:hypothetical protein
VGDRELCYFRNRGPYFGYCVDQPTFWTVEANGFYYNEITGELSAAPIVLRATVLGLVDCSTEPSEGPVALPVHVNILTHLTLVSIDILTQ